MWTSESLPGQHGGYLLQGHHGVPPVTYHTHNAPSPYSPTASSASVYGHVPFGSMFSQQKQLNVHPGPQPVMTSPNATQAILHPDAMHSTGVNIGLLPTLNVVNTRDLAATEVTLGFGAIPTDIGPGGSPSQSKQAALQLLMQLDARIAELAPEVERRREERRLKNAELQKRIAALEAQLVFDRQQ
eukprot:TRINITY_DN6271_c0_g1_i1.p1 TRINITY_DN6271_c0_g1~~TRINITY_DN6271_c0_g1_i1.p1  ORF type:complete len:186 (+),score=26.60 TRINITY_DN6271_c0_g1_i1:54-611(+)